MPTTLRTRKPIDQLQPQDLVAFPIWEFATDEEGVDAQDETWVRPVKSSVVAPGQYSLSVAADFHTASGRHITGFVGVTTAGAFEVDHGVLLHEGKYICTFPKAFFDAERERKALLSALGMKALDVFPLRFKLRVLAEGESILREGVFE